MSSGIILVVEQNAVTRKMMRVALQADGYSVLEADDGRSALRLAVEHTPSLVFLDGRVSDVRASEVARSLAPRGPVIGMVGPESTEASDLFEAGVAEVLVRPVEPSRLLEMAAKHLGPAEPMAGGAGRLVVVADDDPIQRKLVMVALSSAGFDVVGAPDGEGALRLARERRPAAILADVLMPGLDGFALSQAIRADPALARTPIILMSAHYLEEADRKLAGRVGANRFVSRTSGLDAVVHAVSQTLESPEDDSFYSSGDDVQVEHLRRIAHQLERQTSIGATLARRVSQQATALTVLETLSTTLSRQLDPEAALEATLGECLEAAGLSVGAIFLRNGERELTLKAQVGAAPSGAWKGYAALLLRAVDVGGLLVPSIQAGREGEELLANLCVTSALVVPIVARDEALGVLVLASNRSDFSGTEGDSFVRAARAVSMQLGQALALGRTFSKLAATEQRYRALLENARDAIGILDSEGVILEVNRGWEDVVGVSRSEAVGRKFADFTASTPSDAASSDAALAVSRGDLAQSPTSLRRKDGRVVQLELSQTVVNVGDERIVLSIGRDVTARIQLEDQLRQRQKMEAVGSLAGGVAHDFNNLLSVILGCGQMILSDLPPEDAMREDVEEICKAGQRAADLTRQLLLFSRQQVAAPQIVDLNEVLNSLDKMLQRILGEDIELVCVMGVPLGRVRVDPGHIQQLVMNLVVNARDAMPTGGKLTIETANIVLGDEYGESHLGAKPGPHVMLAVSDTGCGMDKATQTRIFEPFFTTKETGKGTGLGLSTVFGIVQQSLGSVWVYSEPGNGTTFKVYLPRVDADAEAEQHQSLAASGGPRGTETILVVEDDPQVRAVILTVLQRHGYCVLAADGGAEALELCEKRAGEIDLVLTDVVMPRMSGPVLAKSLASKWPELKVLFMSGYTDDGVFRHGVLETGLAFLQKPIMPATLTRKVREVLDARGGRSLTEA